MKLNVTSLLPTCLVASTCSSCWDQHVHLKQHRGKQRQWTCALVQSACLTSKQQPPCRRRASRHPDVFHRITAASATQCVPLAYGRPPDNLKPRRRNCTAASLCPASHPSPGSTLARETFTRRLPPRLSLPLPAPGTETDSPATQLRRGE